jgi:UDP-N-acetylmuramate--alanine ligase
MTHVHFIGIGGSGLSAIARLLIESGYTVSGSDRAMSAFASDLQALGADVTIGHAPERVRGADWVVRSSAIPDENPEVQAALKLNIPVFKRADFLGRLMEDKIGIAIAGTHGKTTTTAMMAWTLHALNQDPSFIVGGVLGNLHVNARAGQGSTFVIEADEYDRMFLGLKPRYAVVTNVEHDHPDCYPTPADFHNAFVEFVKLVPANGALIVCADDPGAARIAFEAVKMNKAVVRYGLTSSNVETSVKNLAPNKLGGFSFDAFVSGQSVSAALQVPGEHNVRNALAVLSVIGLMGLPLDEAARALGEFTGVGRRFEMKGEVNGVTVIDDYGHHPTEIRATLAAARARYGDRRLWAVWQPHTYSRTQMLFDEFAHAFSDADQVIVTEIYASREAQQDFSSAQIVKAMDQTTTRFAATLDQAVTLLLNELRSGDVLIVLSAGDADQISAGVLSRLPAVHHA